VKENPDSAPGLKSRSIVAVGWSAIDVAGRQGIQFVVMLILARLLSPAEFGILGMLSLFIALGGSIVDSGFGSALIQRKEITEADKSSVFFFNAAMGALMALTISSAAPWIASFYREPILLPLTRLMALNLFIGSFGVVQVALMTRDLDFKTPFKAGLVAMIVSGALAVWMAWKGYGVWSLAAQSVVFTTVSTGLIWVLCFWKPRLQFSIGSLRSLFGFGSGMLASGLLNTFFDRIQLTVIGKAFSAAQLGFYTRAFSTQQFPVGLLSAVINRVTFPVFSQLSHNPNALRPAVRRTQVSMMVPTLPMMFGLAVVAKPLVLVLFGAKWLPCVPYLRVLSIAGALWPLHVMNLDVVKAAGRSDLFLRLEIIKKVLVGIGILATFRISVMAMVWALLIVSVVCVFVNMHYTKVLIGYGVVRQFVDLAPYAAISLLTSALAWVAGVPLSPFPPLQLFTSVLVGIVAYIAICHLLRLESYKFAVAAVLGVLFSGPGTKVDPEAPVCAP
jgi:O-antigen/teichoic acid export membrane protein